MRRERLQKDNSHGNILEQTTSQCHMIIYGYSNGISEENGSSLVKLESVHDTNDNLCSNDSLVCENLLPKQETSDDMIDVENVNDSETSLLNANHTELFEPELKDFSIDHEDQLSTKSEIIIEPDDVLDSNSSNHSDHSNISLGKETKLENLALSNTIPNGKKNQEIYCGVQEKQNNSFSVNQSKYYQQTNIKFQIIT